MLATQAGNVAAYRQLLTEVGPWLKRYYRNRLPTSMADDAVQDALMAMHQKRHTYDPAQPFIPWLAAIARHKWIDRLRAMKTRATEELPNDLAVLDHGEAVTSARSIELLLAKLKPAQAEAIRLVKLEGLSIEEASARTRQTQSLVKINIYRGLGRLSAMVRSSTDEF
ncbi:MAG: RNA polymerase subunit sigma-24 [Acidiphilium sp. 37-64-53]|nr:MAG: RNA polymerase subunit sigma-24 [Acidiphilium sp. 37-64-53]